MSDPILSPHHENVVRVERQSPWAQLTSGYPPGAIASVVGLFILGAWLAASPIALDYADHPQATSDWISAALVLALGVAALGSRRPWVSWLAGCVGLWVVFSPVVLWTPALAAYVNVTLVGAAIVAVGLLEPLGRRLTGAAIPEGWSYNPSAWSQRIAVIVLSGLSFAIAAYMAAFQLGAIGGVWDPVFGDGTRRVLTSEVSRAFPVSDAALGAATYLLDLLMTCAGDKRRWRSMPWLVILFGILIVPVGIVSVVLVMLQPVAVGAWCFWCLLTASATLIMVPLALDEVAATLQLLRRVRQRGDSWWSVLWRGEQGGASSQPAEPRRPHGHPPWTLAAVIGAGIWTMLSPAALGVAGAAEVSAYLSGALVIVIAVTAASEVARAVRLIAIPVGAWIAIAPWVLAGSTRVAAVAAFAAGLVIVLASLRRGAIGEQRATVDRLAFWPSDATTGPSS